MTNIRNNKELYTTSNFSYHSYYQHKCSLLIKENTKNGKNEMFKLLLCFCSLHCYGKSTGLFNVLCAMAVICCV